MSYGCEQSDLQTRPDGMGAVARIHVGAERGGGPPPIFKTRIKRLLDIDRTFEAEDFMAHPRPTSRSAGGGRGVRYRRCVRGRRCFFLALALDLLDVGFKQSEIVFVMRHLRKPLNAGTARSSPDRLSSTVRFAWRAAIRSCRCTSRRRPRAASGSRVFLILNRIEMTELLPAAGSRPLFGAPEFCEGAASLHRAASYADAAASAHRHRSRDCRRGPGGQCVPRKGPSRSARPAAAAPGLGGQPRGTRLRPVRETPNGVAFSSGHQH